MTGLWILEDKHPVEVDVATFERWHQTNTNVLAAEQIGLLTLVTIFQGRNMRSEGRGPPLLFTTVTQNDEGDGDIVGFWASYDDAMVQHAVTSKRMIADLPANPRAFQKGDWVILRSMVEMAEVEVVLVSHNGHSLALEGHGCHVALIKHDDGTWVTLNGERVSLEWNENRTRNNRH